MLSKTSHLGLSRRVIAYYLMFGLATVTWSVVGMGVVAKSLLESWAESDPHAWSTALSAAEYAPVIFAVPILLVILGAVVLRRTVRPVEKIESQLQRMAVTRSPSSNNLQPVGGPSVVETGWNRLVESFGVPAQHGALDTRLQQVLQGYRQQKSEQILNSLTDGVAVTDENESITFANKAFVSQLASGISAEELCGKTMKDSLAFETAGDSAAQMLDPKFRGRTVVVEIGHPSDTSQGVLRVARSPLHSAQGGGCEGFVWSIRDVTQQKLADQMRDQFVNAATHELRTPMANIKAYAETLALGDVVDVEQQKMFCNTINEEVTRLSRFVDDLLHLSRMEVGATSLKQQVTDMERLLRDGIKKVRSQMERKKIAFEADLPGKLPELVVDKDKLTVALINLLGNAVKYTPDGGQVRLHVEVRDDTMQIDVEDSGIGISVEEIPEVFKKFFRSSDSRVHEQTGSGLGLSLTNEIVRLHGGKLTVHSELNKGSKFTITLPVSSE